DNIRLLNVSATCTGSTAGCSRNSAPLLLQVGGRQEVLRTGAGHDVFASWVAEPFKDCWVVWGHRSSMQRKQLVGFQHRDVSCRSAVDGSELNDKACRGLQRPRQWHRCDCGVVVCHELPGTAKQQLRELHSELGAVASGSRDVRFTLLGCIDSTDKPAGEVKTLRDEACIGWKDEETCRLGLPFYRWTSSEMAIAPLMCFRFCTERGLDLFGLVSLECRCGASALNRQIWHWAPPRAGLSLEWSELQKCTDQSTLRAYRYTGHFEAGGALPTPLVSMAEEDVAYIDSIAKGQLMTAEEEEDVIKIDQVEVDPAEVEVSEPEPPPMLVQSQSHRNQCPVNGVCPCSNPDYPCYAYYQTGGFCACFKINSVTTPENCQAFGGTFCGEFSTTTTTTTTTTTYTGPPTTSTTASGPPDGIGWGRSGPQSNSGTRWPDRRSDPPGNAEDVWQEYVVIKYTFNESLADDNNRKNAFRQAVEMWRDTTCVNFVEEENPSRPYVLVGVWDTGSCYASLGYYSFSSYMRVNLGWCNDDLHVGNMAHELGHILGMSHEQQRPDGPDVFYGKGPHLEVFWDNIASNWQSQYLPEEDVYTGSKNDGSGDPQVGYAPYDFESIMHYGGGSAFDTIPSSQESLVGQRSYLSTGTTAFNCELGLSSFDCLALKEAADAKFGRAQRGLRFVEVMDQAFSGCFASFALPDYDSDSACDNKPEYFVVQSGSFTLEQCQAECVVLTECKGLEHHVAGRCELWIRPEGIRSTLTGITGYTCLAYAPRDPVLFRPVSGDGTNQVCRGSGPGDNLNSYFTVVSVSSLEQCKVACVESSSCTGIEYHESGR
ncbi:unnamed protein product, partial [Cladocopium goreaui]